MSLIKKILIYFTIVIVCIITLEFLAGFIPLEPDVEVAIQTKIDPLNVAKKLDEAGLPQPRVLAHPYFLFENNPAYKNQYGQQHDDYGFRETQETYVKNARLTVLAIGGSTTYGDGVNLPEEVWTHFLQQELSEHGYNVEVLNGGLNYATSAELLARYAFKQQWIQHDILIIHAGGNDFLPISFPGFREDYSHVRLQCGQTSGRLERFFLQHSNILRVVWGAWQQGSNFGLANWQPMKFREIDAVQALERVRDLKRYEPFVRNISTIVRIAQDHGRKVILIPFRNNHYKPVYNRKDIAHLALAITEHQHNLEKFQEKIAGKTGADFFLIEENSILENNFVDNAHLNVAGQREKAEVILKSIERIIASEKL